MPPEIPSDNEDLTINPEYSVPAWLIQAGRDWQTGLEEYRFHVRACADCIKQEKDFSNSVLIYVSQHCQEGQGLYDAEQRLGDSYRKISMKFDPERDVQGYKEWLEERKGRNA